MENNKIAQELDIAKKILVYEKDVEQNISLKDAYEHFYGTDSYFKAKGYERFEKTPFDSETVVCNFQKRFDDDTGIKYYIDIHKHDHSWMPEREKQRPWYTQYGYEYSCQLYSKDRHNPIDLLFHSSWTLEDVENFVENMFSSGMLDYYEKFVL